MLSRPAANRQEVPIKGTDLRRLPKWLDPHRAKLTRFVRYLTEAGAVPLSEYAFIQVMRISLNGETLHNRQRQRWLEEAQVWQNLLLSESGTSRDQRRDSLNDVYVSRTHLPSVGIASGVR